MYIYIYVPQNIIYIYTYTYKYHIYIYTCTIHTHHQGFSVPDTLGRAAAARGAGAPWRSSGVASVGAGVAEPWKLRKNSGFVESRDSTLGFLGSF